MTSEEQSSKNARLCLHFEKRRNELLVKGLLGDEVDDFILEMLDFVWYSLDEVEIEYVNLLKLNSEA